LTHIIRPNSNILNTQPNGIRGAPYRSYSILILYNISSRRSLKKSSSTRLRLSLYVDNATLFINPNKDDVDMIMEIIQNFGEATGLRINLNKARWHQSDVLKSAWMRCCKTWKAPESHIPGPADQSGALETNSPTSFRPCIHQASRVAR
jgi:hypothetical protein